MRLIHLILIFMVILASCASTSSEQENSTEPPSANETNSSSETEAELTSWTEKPAEDLSGSRDMEFFVDGLPNGSVRLIGIFGKNNYMADSTRSRNGSFAFKADQKVNSGMYFILFPGNKYFQLLIDEDQEFSMKTKNNRFVQDMEVKGSLTNELFYKNLKYEKVYKRKLDSIQTKYNAIPEGDMNKSFMETQRDKLIDARKAHLEEFANKYPDNLFTIFKISGQNPDIEFPDGPDESKNEKRFTYLYRNAFWDNVDFSDRRLIRTPVIQNKLDVYFDQLIDKYPDSLIKYSDYLTKKSLADKEMFKYIANYIGVKYKESKVMGGEAVFVHMIENYWTPELAFWSNPEELAGLNKEAAAMKPSLLGMPGQNITCNDPDGNPISLHDLTAEILIVYMYSYECENCRKETPKVKAMYDKWKDKGVDVYALCLDHKEDKWKNYIQKNNLTWNNVWDPNYKSGYHRKYHVDITPEIYVLDGERNIVGKNLKADQLETIFKRLREKDQD